MPSWCRFTFQDRSSPFMRHLSFLHDHVIMIMLFVVVFIFYIIVYLVFCGIFYKYFCESTLVEAVWSVVPAFFLIVLVLPSIQILYFIEDVKSPSFTFKVIGHQWYWSYRVPLLKNMSFSFLDRIYSFFEYDSFIENSDSFPRLLGCSDTLNVPVNFVSRLVVSSTDVIHSFAIPSLGLKVDAVPGRINQIFLLPCRCGVFFGQCSEICGSNHSFMPIVLKSSSLLDYENSIVSFMATEIFEVDSI